MCCRMVHLIADEFLTEERDRKYYADNYTCYPPPFFILFITVVEVRLYSMPFTYIMISPFSNKEAGHKLLLILLCNILNANDYIFC